MNLWAFAIFRPNASSRPPTRAPTSTWSCSSKGSRDRIIDKVTSIRIDKWLWAARFFKTRSLASRACELDRVRSNGQPVKPARDVRVGDLLEVKNDSGEFQIEILALSEMRGPAPVAQALYRETQSSREAREKVAAERKA